MQVSSKIEDKFRTFSPCENNGREELNVLVNKFSPQLFVGPISSTQPNPTHRKVKLWTQKTNPTHNP